MFVKGNYYWLLSEDEYNILSEAMQMYLDENPEAQSFLGDFDIHTDDGYWVADAGDISSEEAEFLATLLIGQYLDYKKSTDSTNFF